MRQYILAFSIEERRNLAQYCSQNPDDCVAFEKLCTAIRPMAYAVMKLHKNVIPYYDKEDYLQEAYITLFRVLKRLAVKPDIINSFSAHLCTAIKNTYCGLFRDYVLHHLVEIRSYDSKENGLTYSQMVYFQEYADSYYMKKRECSKRYYRENREKILEKQRIRRQNKKQALAQLDLIIKLTNPPNNAPEV